MDQRSKDYSKIKEMSELYLGGSRSFSEGALSVFAKHATALSNGLGLALAKQVAESMGGTLTVVSEPGRGSTFTLSLRCAVAGGEAVAAAV